MNVWLQEEGLPRPLAHFPLTGETAGSILLPAYNGGVFTNKQMPSWVDDDKFASVLKCNRVGVVTHSIHCVGFAEGKQAQPPFLWVRAAADKKVQVAAGKKAQPRFVGMVLARGPARAAPVSASKACALPPQPERDGVGICTWRDGIQSK